MSDSKTVDDGGPAFPSDYDMSTFKNVNGGMSLRDYFAAQILTGWLVSRESDVLLAKCGDDPIEAAEMAARSAYIIADAMLAARKDGAA